MVWTCIWGRRRLGTVTATTPSSPILIAVSNHPASYDDQGHTPDWVHRLNAAQLLLPGPDLGQEAGEA